MLRRWCAGLAFSLVALQACGGSTTVADDSVTPASLSSHCTDVVADDLGEGTLCADSGFRWGVDQFSFPNWGRSASADMNVTVQTFIDLFGHSTVCMPGPETECVLRPRTRQKLDEWNVALGGGRCEGMSVLSQRIFLRYDVASDFEPGAVTTSDLDRTNSRLAEWITYWWATQFAPEVAAVAKQSRSKSPVQLVDELIRGLVNRKTGFTVGMYFAGAGHAVTPFAVTKRDDDYVIHVYDNNRPGVRGEIVVSSRDDTWSYMNGLGGEESSAQWSGGTGTLELTPMSIRQGPFTCPFCDDPAPTDATTLTFVNQAEGPANYVMIDAGDAGTIEQTAAGFTVGIAGATVEESKMGTAGAFSVTLPSALDSFRVELRHVRDQITETVVTLRRPGTADLQVRNARSTAVVGAARVTSPLLKVDGSGVTVASHGGDTLVSLAGATNLASVTVADNDTLLVSTVSPTSVEVSYRGTTGASATTIDLDPAAAVATELVLSKGRLDTWAHTPAAQKVTGARTTRNSPLPQATTTSSPRTTVPSVDVTLPG